jgi:deoxyribose-phosphate aldolase
MIRPDYVSEIKKYIQERNSNVAVGTVIGFHEGTYSVEENLQKLQKQLETELMNLIL